MRTSLLPSSLAGLALGLTLTLGLLRPDRLAAQALYNQGSSITVSPGAILSVQGGYEQTSGATLLNEGATSVTGNVQAASGSTLDLSTGDLTVTGNVTNAGTTTATATGTLRLTGTANQTVDLGGGTVGQLIVNKPGGTRVDVPTDLTVTGGLTLTAGSVRTTATSAVVLPTGAPITGETAGRYVQGNLRVTKPNVNGNTLVDFGNSVVVNPQGNTLGDVTVNRAAGLQQANVTYGQVSVAGTNQSSIDRIWTITPQTQPAIGQPAALTMTWVADDDNGLDFTRAIAARRATAAAPWLLLPPPQPATSRSLTVAAPAFSQWTIFGESTVVLPVELLTFEAARAGKAARLTWATASEKNSDYFEVEVSLTGRDFKPVAAIGRVAAQGTSSRRHDYAALDADLMRYGAAVVYYRLRQTDRDGATAYSEIRPLHLNETGTGTLTAVAWPNPSESDAAVQLALTLPTAEPVELTFFDAVGRSVRQATFTPSTSGALVMPLPNSTDGNQLALGTYVLRVRQGAAQATLRLTRD